MKAASDLRVVGDAQHHADAGRVRRPEVARSVAEGGAQGVGHRQDHLSAAVVLLQGDEPPVGVVALELQQVADVAPPPGEQVLEGIAHDAQVAVLGGQQGQQPVLGVVHVLVLVHQDVAVGAAQRFGCVRVLLQQPDGEQEEVVEIDSVATAQHLLVGRVRRHPAPGRSLHVLRPEQPVLGPADGVEKRPPGLALGVEAQVLEGLGERAPSGRPRRRRPTGGRGRSRSGLPTGAACRRAKAWKVPAQTSRADLAQHRGQAALELAARLVGEGDGQHRRGVGEPLIDDVGGAGGDDRRLAGAGAGHHQDCALGGGHGLALLRVELRQVEQRRTSSQ